LQRTIFVVKCCKKELQNFTIDCIIKGIKNDGSICKQYVKSSMLLSQYGELSVYIVNAAGLETDMLISCSEQEEKINRIYEAYKQLMLYAAYQILENREDAEDALQMAMLGICRNASQIDEKASEQKIRSYVVTAAQNAAYSIQRSQVRHCSRDTSLDELHEKAGDVIADERSFIEMLAIQERYREVVEAIRNLPELYREVMFFHYVEEQSIQTIAKRLGRKEDAVRQQLSRGRKMLIRKLKKKEDI